MALSKAKRAKIANQLRYRAVERFGYAHGTLDHRRDHAIRRFTEAGEVDEIYLPHDLRVWAETHPNEMRGRPIGGQ